MSADELLPLLRQHGLIHEGSAQLRSLAGGVSGDIFLCEQEGRRFVVKQALPKLRVKDDWFADVSRNRHEREYLRYVGEFLPDAVPRVLHSDAEHAFFTMEYLGGEFANWKTLLMEGVAEAAHARQAGQILGTIHRHSWDDAAARQRFATVRNFHELRVEPYLLTTGVRHPKLQELFEAEASRLERTALCLVHGDFSPKNILLQTAPPGRMVVLDCEVAWFGDPAFDVAFLLNHLLLKSLVHAPRSAPFVELTRDFRESYGVALGMERAAGMDSRVARLVLMLMLARVDGKSPAEYLTDERQKDFIRHFVHANLKRSECTLLHLAGQWQLGLSESSSDRGRPPPG